MNDEEHELLAAAIRGLRIRDVMLNDATFKRPTPPPSDSDRIAVEKLSNWDVRYMLGEAPTDGSESLKLLQVLVTLELKIVGSNKENDDRPVYFEIGATFLAEYSIHGEVSDAALKLFADRNSVFNCWPFWRQHVFDIVSRGRLPHIDVPLFSALRPDRKRMRSTPASPSPTTSTSR